ncbi:hypothetical protein NM688_g2431 [Phlebia brevispora]|uniref:Uncharacterized protein n=1 Tax=Phlebia brevispora TaxID=194682 RepID=A0ACC1T8W6_9APHY|nr:hypothetical protein NM688_g2431 [Phlebia brevispora]
MPFKRPAPDQHESSGDSSHSGNASPDRDEPPSKRSKVSKSAKILPDVKVYIVQAKLDVATIAELFGLAERNCESVCRYPEDADVIITAITMRKRFERHVSWDVAVSLAFIIRRGILDSPPEIEGDCHAELAARLRAPGQGPAL